MGERASFARRHVCLAAFLVVSGWTVVPSTAPMTGDSGYETLCVLRADPRVRPSYVPPAPVRRGLGPNLTTQSAAANISVTYTGFTPEAQAAFQFAVDLWSAQLSSSVPITIEASFEPLGPGVLGSAGAKTISANFAAGVANTWYPAAIANRLSGFDRIPAQADILARFASGFTWYYGTDGHAPGGTYDFVTVVLHELGHGLGFFGSGFVSSGSGQWGYSTGAVILPTIYDRFVINGTGQSILDTGLFPNPSAALAGQLTGNSLYFSGSFQRAANGNAPARLYAPSTFEPGSSYSHLSEATYPGGTANSLMTPQLASSEAVHDPGPITRGMFQDMGWATNTPACSYSSTASPLAFTAAGGTGSVAITTATGCPWSVSSNAPWITFTSPTSGTGSGTVNFSVASTPNSASRQGTITAQGQALTISQSGVPCTVSVTPTLITFGAAGGSAPLTVTTSAPDCVFTPVTPSGGWISVSGGTVGSTVLTVSTGASGASTRATSIGISGIGAGVQVAVRQNGHATPTFDINNDGAGDLLAFDPATAAHFFAFGDPRNLGFTAGPTSTWSAGWTILPGDFNGDGRGDLFFYNATTGRALKGLSTGTSDLDYTEYAWAPGWQLTVADLNGDGSDDVFVYNVTDGRWFRCITQPDKSFAYTNSGTWSPNWTIVPGDFNGDGRADLFLYNKTGDANHGRWYRVLSNADESVTYIAGDLVWRTDWTITTGDFNGDGITDLFLYRASGDWYRILFTPTTAIYESSGVWSSGWTLTRGDFDGDGRSDLFVYNESTGRWYVVISKADGTLAYYGDVVWSPGWKVSVTDVNVDGVSDLVLYNPTDGRWFQAVTQSPGVFAFASGTWATGLQIHAARPHRR